MSDGFWHSTRGADLATALAIGMAGGWTLPPLAQSHGGGAVIVAWLCCLVIVALPLAWLEMAIGVCLQTDLVNGLRLIRRRWSVLGRWGGWLLAAVALALSLAGGCHLLALGGDGIPAGVGDDAVAAVLAVLAFWVLTLILPKPGRWLLLVLGLGACVAIVLASGETRAVQGMLHLMAPDWHALTQPATWLAAVAQAVLTCWLGCGLVTLLGSLRPRASDVTAPALALVAMAAIGHVFGGMLAAAAAGMAAAPELGGMAAPDVQQHLENGLVLAGSWRIAPGLLVAVLAQACTTGLLLQVAIRPWLERGVPRQALMVFAVVLCAALAAPIAALGSGSWAHGAITGLVIAGVLPLAVLLPAVAAWDLGIGGLRDHIQAYSALRVGRWWRPLLGWGLPPLLTAAWSVRLVIGLREGALGGIAGLGGVTLAAIALLAALAWQRQRGPSA